MNQNESTAHRNDGPAGAAMLSAGIGTAVLGLATCLSEASGAIKALLTWSNPVGPLSGKTGSAVIIWLITWLILHFTWRKKEFPFYGPIFRLTVALIFLGWLGTFPPFFTLFAGGH